MPDSALGRMSDALRLMGEVPFIDGHNDWPHLIRGHYDNRLDVRFDADNDIAGHVDIKRLREGKVGGVFWSAYVDCPKQDDFSDENHMEPLRDTLQQLDLIHRLVDLYRDRLELVTQADDIMRSFQQGRCASLIGVEGLHQIGNSASVLRMYHRLGVRYITLAHNRNNIYADSAVCIRRFVEFLTWTDAMKTAGSFAHGGLSLKGREIVREMNRIGMMIDLSHCSEAVVLDTLHTSIAPVVFTHSSSYTLVPTPRNVTDSALDKLRTNNGVIMISLIPDLTNSDPQLADLDGVVDHIKYVGERIGYTHIGIGSDYDGMVKAVSGAEDISKLPCLVEKMLAGGLSEAEVKNIMGLNIIRVLKDVEAVAKNWAGKEPILEDEVRQLWNSEFRAFVRAQYPNAQQDITREPEVVSD